MPVWWAGVSPFVRKVKTASGATAVQIVSKSGGVRRIVEHLGSAHDETELEALLEAGRQKIAAWQGQGLLDLESLEPTPGHTNLARTTVESKHSRLLWEALHGAYQRLGLGEAVEGDRAFEQMVAARLIEPTSKAQVPRVLGDLGGGKSACGPCSAPWAEPRSEATARASQTPCSSTSPTPPVWPCACTT